MNNAYLPVGNEFISLPTLREFDAAIEQVNVLHMGLNGLVAFDGGSAPFLKPHVSVEGRAFPLEGRLHWNREADWIPRFVLKDEDLALEGHFYCPPGERGFVYSLKATNHSICPMKIALSVEIQWSRVMHSINETKSLEGGRFLIPSGWDGIPALEWRTPEPRLAFSFCSGERNLSQAYDVDGKHLSDDQVGRQGVPSKGTIRWVNETQKELAPNESTRAFFYFGFGLDSIGALTVAREFNRMGGGTLKEATLSWLEKRRRTLGPDRGGPLSRMMNLNAFFNLFFATGRAIDTEEICALTSRSPRYYVSGAYWDRDSLLWSFPSILALDPEYASEMLFAIYTRQRRNFGVHSRYLNGAVLEPGFELDELCAPIIALRSTLDTAGNDSILAHGEIQEGIKIFEDKLKQQRHPKEALYLTWLLPSDDPWPQRYVTYDNVLVWRSLTDLADIKSRMGMKEEAKVLLKEAEAVKTAILSNCVVKNGLTEQFAWSVDLAGKHLFYDEPPGSLLLLPHYGFCDRMDPVWIHTKEWIHSSDYQYSFKGKPFEEVGCAHANHPWVLSAVNSLLAGEQDRALKFLMKARMDNGIACESVFEETGDSATGDAFATCAGFLAFGLWRAIGPAHPK